MQLANMEDVAREVALCRARGVRTYPEALWRRIGELCRRDSIPDVSRRIGISAQYLERRVGKGPKQARFCELKVDPPESRRSERIAIAVRRRDGSEMAMELSGIVDIGRVIAGFMQS